MTNTETKLQQQGTVAAGHQRKHTTNRQTCACEQTGEIMDTVINIIKCQQTVTVCISIWATRCCSYNDQTHCVQEHKPLSYTHIRTELM